MRALLVIVAVVLVLVLIGWISFNNAGDRASVNIETDKIKQDTETVIDAGEDLIDRDRDEAAVDPADQQVDEEIRPTRPVPAAGVEPSVPE
jgi:hypothetical protein